jgi:glutaredoxin-related protein
MSNDIQQRIREQVTTHPVVLYMKGNQNGELKQLL